MTSLRLALPAALLVGLAVVPAASAAGRAEDITWHGTQIHLYDAEATGREGTGVVVAVLDTWVDTTHPDFEGRATGAVDCVGGTCRPGQVRDSCTHGTHVAGTVAASSFGVARKARVLPVQVLTADSKGECTGIPSDVAAGVDYAVAHGAKVINLSLGPDLPGLSSSSVLPAAVHRAAAAGVVVVFSAGNADLPVAQSYGSDALVVAATGPNGQLASYSQHGSGVSVAAPGGQPAADNTCTQATCVTSLYPGGKYAVAAGTSMAAPHVSGLAALLLGQRPGRGRQDVLDRITGTARPLAGAGAGLIDATAALGVSPPATRPPATRAPSPAAVVQPRTAAPRASSPVVRATPVAPAPAPPVATPSPAAVAPVPPSPVVTPSPAAPRALPARKAAEDHVPAPLAVLAVVLLALAGAGVLLTSRTLRR
jgi:subtilisin family serine protease